MSKFIGVKLIEAEPMTRAEWLFESERITAENASKMEAELGYRVIYENGYTSWSPKDVFEKAYLKIETNSRLTKSDISISQSMVDNFIKEVETSTIGEKTTLVKVTLVNGFEIIESSACVDKNNYSEDLGKEVCLNKIKDRVWYLLGFLLQTGVGGIK